MQHDRHGFSNYRQLDCLYNRWSRLTAKEPRITGLLIGIPLTKGHVMQIAFPCHDVIIIVPQISATRTFWFDVIDSEWTDDGGWIRVPYHHSEPMTAQWIVLETSALNDRGWACHAGGKPKVKEEVILLNALTSLWLISTLWHKFMQSMWRFFVSLNDYRYCDRYTLADYANRNDLFSNTQRVNLVCSFIKTHFPFLSYFNSEIEHYNDDIMVTMASQITVAANDYSAVCCGADQRKHQSSASLAFVRGIHR